jgi:hypothetical protein
MRPAVNDLEWPLFAVGLAGAVGAGVGAVATAITQRRRRRKHNQPPIAGRVGPGRRIDLVAIVDGREHFKRRS